MRILQQQLVGIFPRRVCVVRLGLPFLAILGGIDIRRAAGQQDALAVGREPRNGSRVERQRDLYRFAARAGNRRRVLRPGALVVFGLRQRRQRDGDARFGRSLQHHKTPEIAARLTSVEPAYCIYISEMASKMRCVNWSADLEVYSTVEMGWPTTSSRGRGCR